MTLTSLGLMVNKWPVSGLLLYRWLVITIDDKGNLPIWISKSLIFKGIKRTVNH